jgi:hypothetical protein
VSCPFGTTLAKVGEIGFEDIGECQKCPVNCLDCDGLGKSDCLVCDLGGDAVYQVLGDDGVHRSCELCIGPNWFIPEGNDSSCLECSQFPECPYYEQFFENPLEIEKQILNKIKKTHTIIFNQEITLSSDSSFSYTITNNKTNETILVKTAKIQKAKKNALVLTLAMPPNHAITNAPTYITPQDQGSKIASKFSKQIFKNFPIKGPNLTYYNNPKSQDRVETAASAVSVASKSTISILVFFSKF